MKCPNCDVVDLLMSERQGIEIDYCPKCRGVWLDRGELDKFIQQSERQAPNYETDSRHSKPSTDRVSSEHSPNRESQLDERYDARRRDDDNVYQPHPQRAKKKESFFSNLFDFD